MAVGPGGRTGPADSGVALRPRGATGTGSGQCEGPSAGEIQVHYAEQAWQALDSDAKCSPCADVADARPVFFKKIGPLVTF